MSAHGCSASVYGLFRDRPCSRRGVIEREGRWYCRQHEPVAVKARNIAAARARQNTWDDRDRKQALAAKRAEAFDLVKAIAIDDCDAGRLCCRFLQEYDALEEQT